MLMFDVLVKEFFFAEVIATALTLEHENHLFLIHHHSPNHDKQWYQVYTYFHSWDILLNYYGFSFSSSSINLVLAVSFNQVSCLISMFPFFIQVCYIFFRELKYFLVGFKSDFIFCECLVEAMFVSLTFCWALACWFSFDVILYSSCLISFLSSF